jgi:hypothetical protein
METPTNFCHVGRLQLQPARDGGRPLGRPRTAQAELLELATRATAGAKKTRKKADAG